MSRRDLIVWSIGVVSGIIARTLSPGIAGPVIIGGTSLIAVWIVTGVLREW